MGKPIDLPDTLTEVQLHGHACLRCSDEQSVKRPVEAWSSSSTHRLRITEAGRRLYEREWARYRELYPDLSVPEPAAVAVGADR
jgi:hypothetical protein